jgi:hypothetical protein
MDECYLRARAVRSLEILDQRFPDMATAVKEELRTLPEKATSDGRTRPSPTRPGYLERWVYSEEAEDALKNPPLKEPPTPVAPDCVIVYKPLSLKEQWEFRARRLVIDILTGSEAAERFTLPFPLPPYR